MFHVQTCRPCIADTRALSGIPCQGCRASRKGGRCPPDRVYAYDDGFGESHLIDSAPPVQLTYTREKNYPA